MEWFPVLTITRRNAIVAVNVHKAVLDEEIIDDLLQLDGKNNEQQPVPQERRMEEERQQAEKEQGKKKRKPGLKKGQGSHPTFHLTYPHLVDNVGSFVQLHGFAADERQPTEKATLCGVTFQQSRTHVWHNTPGLHISCWTIHHLMLPPRKARLLKELYKSLISVCVPSKRNIRTCSNHKDHHYTMAQVAYRNEFFQLYEEECICIYQQMTRTRSMLGHWLFLSISSCGIFSPLQTPLISWITTFPIRVQKYHPVDTWSFWPSLPSRSTGAVAWAHIIVDRETTTALNPCQQPARKMEMLWPWTSLVERMCVMDSLARFTCLTEPESSIP